MHAIFFRENRTVKVVQIVYKIRLITGTRDLTCTGDVLHFVTVAHAERHKRVDSVGILSLGTFRI